MGYAFDGGSRLITLTPGTTIINVRDLYSRWKDWVLDGNSWALPAFESVGGNALGGGRYAGDYYFLLPGWAILPHDADHILGVDGNLFPLVIGAALFAARPGRTIQIQFERSQRTQTIAVGSGVLPSDVGQIASAVRDAILSDGTPFAGARIDAAISSRALPGAGLTIAQATILARLETLTAELHRLGGLDASAPVAISETAIVATGINVALATANGITTMQRAL